LGIDTPFRLLLQPVQLCVREGREKARLRSVLPGTERFFQQRFLLQSAIAVLPGTPERQGLEAIIVRPNICLRSP
jgi:hypothetical protein